MVASQSVHLTWLASPSSEVAGYNIYYGLESGIYTVMLSGGTNTEVDVQGLQSGLVYYFVVTARNPAGQESDPSNEASYGLAGILPPEGTPLIQQVLPDHAMTLGWNPSPSPAVVGYYVHYGIQSGVYDKVVWVENATSVDIHELADGQAYYFVVAATNSFGQVSGFTPEISYSIPQLVPPQAAPIIRPSAVNPDMVTLTWPASPSAAVAGYIVYFGTESGQYDSWYYVSSAAPLDLGGFVPGLRYFFAISAYDDLGQESERSAEAAYYFEQVAVEVPPTPIVLTLQQVPVTGFPNTFAISATGPIPEVWTVEGSSDLVSWHTLATGVAPEVNVTVVVTEKPALFFRLASWFSDLTLELQAPPDNPFPGALLVATPYTVPWDWTLEASEDLKTWNPLAAGYYSPVKVAIVNAPVPALFFRLKGG